MTNILILYGTTEGQTEKIADHMATVARARGHAVDARPGAHLPADFAPTGFDAIIVGASVHIGEHQKYIRDFVARNRALLETRPSAFFSVSGAAADPKGGPAQAETFVAKFIEETGWQPKQVGVFAGAVPYTHYGLIKRFVMKMIMKRAGGGTDTTRDYDYTDWQAVTRFAERFVDSLPRDAAFARPPDLTSRTHHE